MNESDIKKIIMEALKESGADLSDMIGIEFHKVPVGTENEDMIPHDLAFKLSEKLNKLREYYTFEVGQILQFKPGMRDVDIGPLFIVSEILKTPVIDSLAKSNSADFRAVFDMKVGVVSDGGKFLEFHVDSRRFEPYTGPDNEKH